MSLSQCMRRHTHRQFLVWQRWLAQEWNNPSRADHYAMQAALEARRANQQVKLDKGLELGDFKIKFKTEEVDSTQSKPLSPDNPLSLRNQHLALAKSQALAMVAGSSVEVTQKVITREEAIIRGFLQPDERDRPEEGDR